MFDALRRLEVWKRACRFSVDVYAVTAQCGNFAYRDQVTRSGLSIASNIAEGYERDSRKDRVRFMYMAKGSCGECWTQLLIGMEAGLIDRERGRALAAEAHELSRMLRGWIVAQQETGQVDDQTDEALGP